VKAKNKSSYGIILVGVALLFSTACTTKLAPNYDKAIVDGLTSTNVKLMELFAETSSGTTPGTFDQREKSYNSLIGNLDALTIQAKSRPIPKNRVTEKVNEYLQRREVTVLEGGEAPSAAALGHISETIVKMRDTDKEQGVTFIEVAAFKGQVVIYLDQAMTYEGFLER
jgi:hypothetical protein